MGTRAQVFIQDSYSDDASKGVYLYQHWDGDYLFQEVQNAIAKGDRWNDPEYLTRIIFCEMVKTFDQVDGSTGYGIGTSQHGDIEYLVIVDIENQNVIEDNLNTGKRTVKKFSECRKEEI